MTGSVTSIEAPGTCCHIREDLTGMVYFAHELDFVDPTTMVLGMDVDFRPKLARGKGKHPPATDVIAIQRKAA